MNNSIHLIIDNFFTTYFVKGLSRHNRFIHKWIYAFIPWFPLQREVYGNSFFKVPIRHASLFLNRPPFVSKPVSKRYLQAFFEARLQWSAFLLWHKINRLAGSKKNRLLVLITLPISWLTKIFYYYIILLEQYIPHE